MIVLERYDGCESLVFDPFSCTLFLLYDYGEKASEWFCINCHTHFYLLAKFFEKQVSLRFLLDICPVSMVLKNYGEQRFYQSKKKLPDSKDYPDEDSFWVGDDFLR